MGWVVTKQAKYARAKKPLKCGGSRKKPFRYLLRHFAPRPFAKRLTLPTSVPSHATSRSPLPHCLVRMNLQTKHLLIPYVVGIAWIFCHPIISIITGELKCRGVYTDEHQLDIRGYETDPYPQPIRRNSKDVLIEGVMVATDHSNACNVLETLKSQYVPVHVEKKNRVKDNNDLQADNAFNPFLTPYITCHSQNQHEYSIVRIQSSLAPTTPVEALVLVIPYAANWFESDLHSIILAFMERMSKSPWLAKTILIVSPNSNSTSLESTVEKFAEESSYASSSSSWSSSSLPHTFRNCMIRQLVVLQVRASTDYKKDQMVILVHGSVGTVPNLDLVSGVTLSIQQMMGRAMKMTMHPFDLGWWEGLVKKHLPKGKRWQEWGVDLGHMVAFMAAFWR